MTQGWNDSSAFEDWMCVVVVPHTNELEGRSNVTYEVRSDMSNYDTKLD